MVDLRLLAAAFVALAILPTAQALPGLAPVEVDAPTSPLHRLLAALAQEVVQPVGLPDVEVPVEHIVPGLPTLPTLDVGPVVPGQAPAASAAPRLEAHALFVCRAAGHMTVQLRDHSTPGSSHIVLWKWQFGDGSVHVAHTFSDNPTSHAYASPGAYEVSLTVRLADGGRSITTRVCEASAPEFQAAVPIAPAAPPAAPPPPPPPEPFTPSMPQAPMPAAAPAAAIEPAPASQAVTVAAVAGTAGLGLLAAAGLRWIRFLPLAGLFTRLREDELLEHPVRRQIVDVVAAEPGIHYQALVRALEKGNGVLEHHLRMLVQGNILKERQSSGYTCYFPAATDRRLMDAHAVLKSDVARRLLETLVARPGDAIGSVARQVGVTPKAVTYHLTRFEGAGLVTLQKVGRTVQAYASPLAQQFQGAAPVATA